MTTNSPMRLRRWVQTHSTKFLVPHTGHAACKVCENTHFLFNVLRFFQARGVKVQRVMTDNGVSFRSRRYAKALRMLKIKHLRTKPYTPKTNRKAERFVQTSLREWAHAQAYLSSDHWGICPA